MSVGPVEGGFPTDSWQRSEPDGGSGIRALVAEATGTDGVSAVSGHVLAAIDAGGAEVLVAGSEPAQITGLAVAVADDPAEVVVRPAARGRGLGSALVRAAIDRQGAVWAYGDLPGAAAVANRLGLVRGRVLLQLRRTEHVNESASSGPIIGSALPAGVRVRTFVPGQDEEAFLAVNGRAFAWHPEQGRLDLVGLMSEMAQSWFDPSGFFLAVTTDDRGERLLGFHWTKVHASDPNPGKGGQPGPIGEIYVLGVDPQAGVRGLGTSLTRIGLEYLANRGLDTVMLYVEGDNERALRLYRRFGFSTYLANVVYHRSAPAEQ